MTIDFDTPADKVMPPASLAHVVLRTAQFPEMNEFYKTFLGAYAVYERENLSFLTYDEEHHRIALFQVPGTTPKVKKSSGLEHIAFTYKTLDDLALAYRQRKQKDIIPSWCVNHGPTTSIYYEDPDGNTLETQVDNFNSPEEATAFMESKEFLENPFGTDFDPEHLINRLRSGEHHDSIKKRIEIGPRGVPAHAA
ncbi:uncharacterized protein PV06_04135 [Exophiala oligosperma]|uniref:VOC domain-containing protein n=1 Tax=Exophiala oligosperma TaxID=215243 RepID=A0A0D2ECS3_9EURO|nr:uncharacterized protein PV06_04135 [Exophiala oligosperma]KIW45779.1 hypothetical protein PV06_04135 [Exophiala oligosperma]